MDMLLIPTVMLVSILEWSGSYNLSGTVTTQSLENWVEQFKGFAWGNNEIYG